MSILVDETTRVLVQGITGFQGRMDTAYCLEYGTRVVAGVTPGRGGQSVHGVPVFDTVAEALDAHPADATVLYVPAPALRDAVFEALDGGLRLLLAAAENVPLHDAAAIRAAAHDVGAWVVGPNSNGIISPGKSRLAGLGGPQPERDFFPGTVGVCSRSGGMCAEIAWTLGNAGLGVSTCISMGGDAITGMRMIDYVRAFDRDPDTDAIVLFGEPGSTHEQEVAAALAAGEIRTPVVALVAGEFQQRYPKGRSFGHFAAIITDDDHRVTVKRKVLAAAGAAVARSLSDIPSLVRRARSSV